MGQPRCAPARCPSNPPCTPLPPKLTRPASWCRRPCHRRQPDLRRLHEGTGMQVRSAGAPSSQRSSAYATIFHYLACAWALSDLLRAAPAILSSCLELKENLGKAWGLLFESCLAPRWYGQPGKRPSQGRARPLGVGARSEVFQWGPTTRARSKRDKAITSFDASLQRCMQG